MVTKITIELPPEPPEPRVTYKYRTSDGKEFDFESQALDHARALAREEICKFKLFEDDNYTVYSNKVDINSLKLIHGNPQEDNKLYIFVRKEDRYGDSYITTGTWSGLYNYLNNEIEASKEKFLMMRKFLRKLYE